MAIRATMMNFNDGHNTAPAVNEIQSLLEEAKIYFNFLIRLNQLYRTKLFIDLFYTNIRLIQFLWQLYDIKFIISYFLYQICI